MQTPIQRFLERLPTAKQVKSGAWKACCPAHDDKQASLSLSTAEGGKVLLNCFAGCSAEDVVKALGLTMSDLYPSKRASKREKFSNPSKTRATAQQLPGCTLADYAEAKRLPAEYLQSLGLTQFTYQGRPAVRIPYFGVDGREFAVRFRGSPEIRRSRQPFPLEKRQ